MFGRTEMGSVVTENPKAEIAENFGRIQREWVSQICLESEDGGGSRKLSKVVRGDHFSKVTSKGGIG